MTLDYAITFACYNQLDYTQQCIDSLRKAGYDLGRLVVVDNDSTDETAQYLKRLPLGGLILNRSNLGCGTAWNQGILSLQAEWTVVMNNDILVSPGWLEGLIDIGAQEGLHLVSPGMIEGEDGYNFELAAATFYKKMSVVRRLGQKHAVCMAIHKSVWEQIGYFRAEPKLLGYEDTLFFHAFEKAGLQSAIVGSSWIHHFGSVTQKAMKQERGLSLNDDLGYRWNSRLLNQGWLERKLRKVQRKRITKAFRDDELRAQEMTLHGIYTEDRFVWR